MNGSPSEDNRSSRRTVDRLAEIFTRDYMLIDKDRISPLASTIALAFFIGITVTIGWFASQNGFFEAGSAQILSSSSFPPLQKRLIYYGWSSRDSRYVKTYWQKMETMPFDGIGINIPIDRSKPGDTSNFLGWQVFSTRQFSVTDFQAAIDELKSIRWSKFTDNFLFGGAINTPELNFFDDARWAKATNNIKVLASIASQTGMKGIIFDPEYYGSAGTELFSYPHQNSLHPASFSEYQAKARQCGREFEAAIASVFPNAKILTLVGYTYMNSRVHYNPPLETSDVGLLGSFYDGMLEAMPSQGQFIDSNETCFLCKDEGDFKNWYDVIKNPNRGAIQYSAAPDLYRQKVRAGFARWLDYYQRVDYFSPSDFQKAATNALKYTDEYVWIYSQKPDFFPFSGIYPPSTVPQYYLDGLNAARATVANSFDYHVMFEPDQTVVQGGSIQIPLTIRALSGTPQGVTLALSGLPANSTSSFSSTTCTPAPLTCAVTLTLTASNLAISGAYSLTVTSTSNGLAVKTAAINLQIVAPIQIYPIAHWKFDETSGMSASDTSANGNSGTLVNGPVWTSGKAGGGLAFDGIDDYVKVSSNASLNLSKQFSISLWLNGAVTGSRQALISKDGVGTDTTGAYDLYIGPSRELIYETNNIGATLSSAANWVPANKWTHIAVTFSEISSTVRIMRLYVDGIQVAIGNRNRPSVLTTDLLIGRSGTGDFLKGTLDDIRLYNRALSFAEIQALYTAGGTGMLLTTSRTGTGAGTITGYGIACGTDCTEYYPGQTLVMLTASSISASTFTGWSGGCTGTAPTCFVKMDASKNVQAAFNAYAPFNYSFATTGDQTLVQGKSVQIPITIQTTAGTPQLVSASMTGLPSGVSGSSSSCTPTPQTCSLTLTLTAAVSAPIGSYLFTITSSSSGLSPKTLVNNLFVITPAQVNPVAQWKFDETNATSTVIDSSGNGSTGTLVNGPVWATGKIGRALSFDGKDDYVLVPKNSALNVTQQFSFSTWVNIAGTTTTRFGILTKDIVNGDTTGGYNIYIGPRGELMYETNNLEGLVSPINKVPFNQWAHIAITYNNSLTPKMRMYVNGVEVATGNPIAPSLMNKIGLLLGRRGLGDSFLKGSLDDFRMYARTLSPSEIQAIYRLSN